MSPLLSPSPPPSRLRGVPGLPHRGGSILRCPRSGRAPPGSRGVPAPNRPRPRVRGPRPVPGGGISRCTPGPGVPFGHLPHPPQLGGRSGPFSQALNWGLCSLSALWGGRAGVLLSLPPAALAAEPVRPPPPGQHPQPRCQGRGQLGVLWGRWPGGL